MEDGLEQRDAFEKLYLAAMRYCAEHDGYAKHSYMEAAIIEAEHALYGHRLSLWEINPADWRSLGPDKKNDKT